MSTLNRPTLEMALVGYQAQAAKIEAAIAELHKELGVRGPRAVLPAGAGGAKPKRVLSASARKRMADAQKRRWAAFHAAKTAAPKRQGRLSAATRDRLAANLAKARAAKAAKAA